jgi:hypothetical protein
MYVAPYGGGGGGGVRYLCSISGVRGHTTGCPPPLPPLVLPPSSPRPAVSLPSPRLLNYCNLFSPNVLVRSVPHLLLRDTDLRLRTALMWLGVPPTRGHVHDCPRPRIRRERRRERCGVGSRRRLRIQTMARPWVGPGDASTGGDRCEDQKGLHRARYRKTFALLPSPYGLEEFGAQKIVCYFY